MTRGWHIARVTIEAASPLSCASGRTGTADNLVVRDANGFPMIPGPTLQGLSRSLCLEPQCTHWFGSRPGDASKSPGKIVFSHAAVHASDDCAVGFPIAADYQGDALLARLISEVPLKREHVRLDHRHTGEDGGKFDRAAVPRGTRFSFELMYAGEEADNTPLNTLVNLLGHPFFRVGGGSRRGYGKISIVDARCGFFREPHALQNLRERPFSDKTGLAEMTLGDADHGVVALVVRLTPLNPWRTGQDGVAVWTGKKRRKEADTREKPVDAAPLREDRIVWEGGRGSWVSPQDDNTEGYVVPGSAIRGPLSHRSVYHWNRANGYLITPSINGNSEEDAAQALRENLAQLSIRRGPLKNLFGFAKEGGASGGEQGQVSAVLIEDVLLPGDEVRTLPFDHNSIDRFTGGVRDKMLFSEELILPREILARILIDGRRAIDRQAREAFCEALYDLLNGKLAIGAKSRGFCNGDEPEWTGPGAEDWQKTWREVTSTPTLQVLP